MQKTNDVIALGNALMDFLVEVKEGKLLEFGLKKGEFKNLEEEEARELLKKLEGFTVETVPGGSSANTLRGLAFLGGKTVFCSKVGEDIHGENYIKMMKSLGVLTKINKNSMITGHAITFITPDSERTFSVYLGAALKVGKEDISEEDIQKSKILQVEGYHLGASTKETAYHIIDLAKKHGTLVSLDLADAGVVRKNKEVFQKILPKIDILFANEKEAKELTGLEPEEAVQELAEKVKIAIVKLGEKGSLICQDGVLTLVDPIKVKAVDTTGAGDLYASGFLYGYLQGWEVEKAGRLGSLMAAKIVEQKGVRVDRLEVEEIKKEFV